MAGDSRERLADLADGSIDAVVTDPPYELGFMGKSWDASGVAYDVALWAEVLRVLKPGGHLLAFGGTRTYHRMAVAIEDAGFEIRDSIHWLYGSGFPKSLDVSKAIDKAAGAEREVTGPTRPGAQRTATNAFGVWGDGITPTAPATSEAATWDGWGTALKPAHEPIVVARKPLDGTVAANVLAHGTGALNIDGCRIGTDDRFGGGAKGTSGFVDGYAHDGWTQGNTLGRWPANVVLDPDAAEVLDRQSGDSSSPAKPFDYVRTTSNSKYGKDLRPEGQHVTAANYGDSGGASRFFYRADHTDDDLTSFRYVAKPDRAERDAGLDGMPTQRKAQLEGAAAAPEILDDVSARFLSQPVANFHPTVKPIDLMRWLVRLVTPPDGTVLDPFAGSGTTLVAATLEHRHSIGIELTDDYHPIIRNRCTWAEHRARFGPLTGPTNATAEPITPTLFDEDGAA
jgi:site-specific DNA-methyltransferase (adenine-specific)